MQPPRNRKDHYVPQGYLRGFIDPARARNDRPLWCLNKWRNQWERKSPRQICHLVGMYDFSNDAIEVEHADMTFKLMEDEFPSLRDELIRDGFRGWRRHLDFLCRYMQMIRVRSPQFFVDQGREIDTSFVGRVTGVDDENRKITLTPNPRLSDDEIHDFTLTKMREEFKKGAAWMADFHWQIRTVPDSSDPVIASEAPLFFKGDLPLTGPAPTMEMLKHESAVVYFPLSWQACLVGRLASFDSDVEPFGRADLLELRHMIAEMAPQYAISPQRVDSLTFHGKSLPSIRKRG